MVATKDNTVVVEISGPLNESLRFVPLGRSIRGKFDFSRVKNPDAMRARLAWADTIPSQRIGLDAAAGVGFIQEPIHDDPHLVAVATQRGLRLAPRVEEFPNCDVPTWSFWLKRAVQSGLARVVSGTLPEVEGEPRTNTVLPPRQETNADRLATAIETLTALLERLMPAAGKSK